MNTFGDYLLTLSSATILDISVELFGWQAAFFISRKSSEALNDVRHNLGAGPALDQKFQHELIKNFDTHLKGDGLEGLLEKSKDNVIAQLSDKYAVQESVLSALVEKKNAQ
jgi:hypothetical protein